MRERYHKEGWAPKNWCFWTVVLEILESPLDSKEIKLVNPRGNQTWIFIGRTHVEAKALILWPPDGKIWHLGKDLDAGKYWGQEETGTTEDELVGWHYWLNGHKFEETQGDIDGQRGLVCCSPWGCKDSYMTSWLNNSNNNKRYVIQSQRISGYHYSKVAMEECIYNLSFYLDIFIFSASSFSSQ